MQQYIAFGQSLQNLSPEKGSREYSFIGYVQFAGEPLQPFPLWPVANDPVLSGWVSLMEVREGPQAKFEALQVQEISNTDHTERIVLSKRDAAKLQDFIAS
jgi:hypothetical protein